MVFIFCYSLAAVKLYNGYVSRLCTSHTVEIGIKKFILLCVKIQYIVFVTTKCISEIESSVSEYHTVVLRLEMWSKQNIAIPLLYGTPIVPTIYYKFTIYDISLIFLRLLLIFITRADRCQLKQLKIYTPKCSR